MTHLPNPVQRGQGSRVSMQAWVLVCDGCGHECWQDGTRPEYATYVPDPWQANADGTHQCPDCVSRAAIGHTVGCFEHPSQECSTPGACAPIDKEGTLIA